MFQRAEGKKNVFGKICNPNKKAHLKSTRFISVPFSLELSNN
jgi:hypothetical protein